jgi:hypothetical protein
VERERSRQHRLQLGHIAEPEIVPEPLQRCRADT